MSTKIYTGIRFTAANDAEALACLEEIRIAIATQVRTEVATLMARWVAGDLDAAALGVVNDPEARGDARISPGDTDPRTAAGTERLQDVATTTTADAPPSPYGAAWVRFTERMKELERSRRHDPEVDFEVSVRVFQTPYGVLGIYDTDRPTLRQILLNHPAIEEYGYWNNTDPEEDVSEAEWAMRGTAWTWVIAQGGNTGSVAEVGTRVLLSDRLTATLAAPTPEEIAAQMPTPGDRARRFAYARAVEEIVEAADGSVNARTVFGLYAEALASLKTPAGQARIAEHEAWVRSRLSPVLTAAHVRDGFVPSAPPRAELTSAGEAPTSRAAGATARARRV